jgi:radical SAM superfamily enzyme YgiQ (UPF0313 family)
MKTRILLIMPDANMHKFMILGVRRSAREAPLTLTTLAALTGDNPDIEYKLIDESVDDVPLDWPADLVGISIMTGTSLRGYALADHFRRRGIPVVLGGVHCNIMPAEAKKFADSIMIGMADVLWKKLVDDFRAGNLQPEYREPPPEGDFTGLVPTPRWDLQRKSGYMMPYVLQVTRGCMHSCDFCSVPVVYKKYLRRPIADIVKDVKAMPGKRFVINDVSPFDDIEYSKELFKALIPLNKKWGGLSTSRIADDPELFDLMVKSGCQYLLIGFESVNQSVLNSIYKGFNKGDRYKELMYKLHSAGIIVQGCFVFGFDEDQSDVFDRTVERVQELKIDIPRYSIYTPYPGTHLFERLNAENRILSYNWGLYDTMHVVYQPKQLSPVELYEGFRGAYRKTFKINNILQRTLSAGTRFPIAFMGNLTYRAFVKRLYMKRGFEMPMPYEKKPEVFASARSKETPLA